MDTIVTQLITKRNSLGLSVPKLAEVLGIPSDRIYKWEQGKGNPKGADVEKVKNWLEEIPDNSKVPESEYGKTYTEKALYNLTESNRLIAESNASLAQSNKELVQMVKAKTIGDDHLQTEKQLNVVRRAVVEFLLQVAAGKRWKTEEEAGLAYSRRIGELLAEDEAGDIQKRSDKTYSGIQS
jgi:transcriptional regulator with XRE-family HTH domain